MPARQNDDDCTASLQTGTHGGLVFFPQSVAVGGRFSFSTVFDGVINNKQIGTVACDGATDAD